MAVCMPLMLSHNVTQSVHRQNSCLVIEERSNDYESVRDACRLFCDNQTEIFAAVEKGFSSD